METTGTTQLDLTFEDYVKVSIHLGDKNQAYTQAFCIADGDPDAIPKNFELSDNEVNKRLTEWSEFFNVKPQYHKEIQGYEVKTFDDLSVENWMMITQLIDSAEHSEQTFIPVLKILFKDDLDIEIIKGLHFKKCVETVSFFLSNSQNAMAYTLTFSHPNLRKAIRKRMIEKIKAQLPLN